MRNNQQKRWYSQGRKNRRLSKRACTKMIKEIVSKNSLNRILKKLQSKVLSKKQKSPRLTRLFSFWQTISPRAKTSQSFFKARLRRGLASVISNQILLLIYKIEADILYLTRIGRHQDIFKKYWLILYNFQKWFLKSCVFRAFCGFEIILDFVRFLWF